MTTFDTTFDPAPFISQVKFNDAGLVPVIAQDHERGDILMMAWMNAAAITETLTTGRVCYWSRSRGGLWRKGETSGQSQRLINLLIDCDGDTLLAMVAQDGVACHTGRRSCFYRAASDGQVTEIAPVTIDPAKLYGLNRLG